MGASTDSPTRPPSVPPEGGAPSFVPPVRADLAADLPAFTEERLVPARFLAMGGMGEVTEVEDRALRRRVAKKTLHVDLQRDVRSQRMLIREARVTGQLEHPNIVPVQELGVDADGRLFFTMKKVEGRTLQNEIDSLPPGPFVPSTLLDLLEIVVKVCDALAFAHARGVVHCDLKAANVMVGDFGEVYLMDWGIARVLGESATARGLSPVDDGLPPDDDGSEEAVCGTPSHMAPEQARGAMDRIGPHTDVFAVGALLYELITGKAPYRSDYVVVTLCRAATGEHGPVEQSERGAALPESLLGIVRRAMQLEPADRYPSITALRDDLVRFLRGEADFPRRTFAAGTIIVHEGDEGDAAFRILEGRCDVFRRAGHDSVLVRSMGPGEIFGEMAILSPGPRTATVFAATDVVAEVVTAEVFLKELSTMKPWLASVVRTLADRFRDRGL